MSKIIKAEQVALFPSPLAVPQPEQARRTRRAHSGARASARGRGARPAPAAAPESGRLGDAGPVVSEPRPQEAHHEAAIDGRADALLREATEKAARVLAEAEERAAALVASARSGAAREIEAARAQAAEAGRSAGFEAGLAEGREAARTELAAGLEAVARLVAAAREERLARLADLADDIVSLALHVAEKMLVRPLAEDPEVARRVLADLLPRAQSAVGSVRVRVAPPDLERLGPAREALLAAAEGIRELTLVADPSLLPGSIVLETDWGTIDARWETRWGAIASALGEVERHGA